MSLGKHVITFRARSPALSFSPYQNGHPQSSSCQMVIHVKDPFPPRVRQCPESFTEYLIGDEKKKRVSWTEPIFHDNVKVRFLCLDVRCQCRHSSCNFRFITSWRHIYLVTDFPSDDIMFSIKHPTLTGTRQNAVSRSL